MKKMVFKVILHLYDGSKNDYRVAAKDDIEARSKAANEESNSWDGVDGKYPGLKFAETELICELDAA